MALEVVAWAGWEAGGAVAGVLWCLWVLFLCFGPWAAPCLGSRGVFMMDRVYHRACTTVYD